MAFRDAGFRRAGQGGSGVSTVDKVRDVSDFRGLGFSVRVVLRIALPGCGDVQIPSPTPSRCFGVLHRRSDRPRLAASGRRSRSLAGCRPDHESRASVPDRRLGRPAGPPSRPLDLAGGGRRLFDPVAVDQGTVFVRLACGAIAAKPRGPTRARDLAAAYPDRSRFRCAFAVLLVEPGETRIGRKAGGLGVFIRASRYSVGAIRMVICLAP